MLWGSVAGFLLGLKTFKPEQEKKMLERKEREKRWRKGNKQQLVDLTRLLYLVYHYCIGKLGGKYIGTGTD